MNEQAFEDRGRIGGVTLVRIGEELRRAHPSITRWGIVQERKPGPIRFWVRDDRGWPVSLHALVAARVRLCQLLPKSAHDVVTP